MTSPRRMPTLGPAAGEPSRRRIPLVPRRRAERARNALAWAAGVSAALHLAVIAGLIITFPNKPPQEAAPPTGVQVVFESGAKQAAAPALRQGPNQKAQEAAPRAPTAQAPARLAEAAPPAAPAQPSPPSASTPEVRAPQPDKPVPPPAPRAAPLSKPVRSPPPPSTQRPPTRQPPAPPLPQINLPPPPPSAPPVPTPPKPVDNSQSEMNLELPPMPELAPVPLPLPPPPLPAPPRPQRLTHNNARARSGALGGGVVINGLSFNGGGSRSGGRTRGLNLDLSEAQQPGSQADIKVQGDVGANWIAELEQWIDARKYYPEMAGELNQQGTVVIRFTVDRAGHVSRLGIVTPTGYALLDQAWLGLFRGASLPPLLPSSKADTATITASMRFEILH
jgi:protein TonB